MAGPSNEEISKVVKESISLETGHSGEIEDAHSASDIDGWDSIAHIRIMYRIEMEMDMEMDLRETYSASTIGELVQLVCRKSQQ